MSQKRQWRTRAKLALEKYFRERSYPRLALALLLTVTGLVGFGLSYVMLRLGADHMWVRYPVVVLASYGCFLGLLRLWVEIEHRRFEPEHIAIDKLDGDQDEADREQGSSWLDHMDLPNLVFGDSEGCLFAVLIAVILSLVVALLVTLIGAPALLAEVFLDVFLVAALYRRLRIAAREHWLGTAIRKTWRRAMLVAALLAIGGFCLEMLAPGARSIGPAWEQIRHGKKPIPLERG